MIQYEAEIIKLVVCSFCFHDMYEMTKHPRSWYVCKPELQIGTELHVKLIVHNYFGEFYRCDAPEGMTMEGVTNPEYDIPVWNALVVKRRGIEREDTKSEGMEAPVIKAGEDIKFQGLTAEEAQKYSEKLADLARKVEEAEKNTIYGQSKQLKKAWRDFLLKMFPFLPHLTPVMLAHIVLLSCALLAMILCITSEQWWLAVGNGLLVVNSLINLYVERKYHKR